MNLIGRCNLELSRPRDAIKSFDQALVHLDAAASKLTEAKRATFSEDVLKRRAIAEQQCGNSGAKNSRQQKQKSEDDGRAVHVLHFPFL